jgi:hypothetical protein
MKTTYLWRLGRALAALVASVALAVGCGGEELSPESIAQAADATIEAGGARVALKATITAPDGHRLPLTGKGVMDARGERGRLDMDLSRLFEPASRPPKEQAALSSIFAGYEIFIGGPLLERELPGDKKWIKIDLRKVSRELGFEQLTQLGQNDPRKTLDYLRGTGGVDELGTETVRGVETTRYEATVDLRDYADKLPPRERAQTKAALDRARQLFGGSSEVRMEVWIDDKDLVRRIRQEYSLPIEERKTPAEQTLEFFDFGIPIAVDVPRGDEVQDVSRLAAREARKAKAKN